MRQMAGRIEFTVFQRSHRLPRETGRSRKSLDTRAFRHSYAIDGRIKDCVLIDGTCGSGGLYLQRIDKIAELSIRKNYKAFYETSNNKGKVVN